MIAFILFYFEVSVRYLCYILWLCVGGGRGGDMVVGSVGRVFIPTVKRYLSSANNYYFFCYCKTPTHSV